MPDRAAEQADCNRHRRGYRADEAAEETAPPRREVRLRAPLFDPAERRLSPAEAGTAHHLFMQFCDFAEAEKPGGVERELARLAERGILSEKQAAAVKIPRIEAFSPRSCTAD